MIRIITGATGTAHVTSADDGAINCGMMGDTSGVLKAGAKLEATIVDNNTIRISDGDIMMQGRVGRVEPNTTEDMTISTGTVGTYRKDLIVVRYQMDNNTGYESMNLVVIEGTETSGTATDPAYNEGVIRTGASIVDMPLYRVNLDGINITGIDKLFVELDNIGSFKEVIEDVQGEVAELTDQLTQYVKLINENILCNSGNTKICDYIAPTGYEIVSVKTVIGGSGAGNIIVKNLRLNPGYEWNGIQLQAYNSTSSSMTSSFYTVIGLVKAF